MELTQNKYYRLERMHYLINRSNSKVQLENIKSDLLTMKKSIFGFNPYAFTIGLIMSHTSLIYYKKQTLVVMEKFAYAHIGTVLLSAVVYGLIYGYYLGNNSKNYLLYKRLLSKTEEKLNKVK